MRFLETTVMTVNSCFSVVLNLSFGLVCLASLFSPAWEIVDGALKSKIYFSGLAFCLFLPVYVSSRLGKEGSSFYPLEIILLSGVLLSCYGILQYVGIAKSVGTFTVKGNFDNTAGYASALSICFASSLCFLREKTSVFSIGCFVLISVGLLLSSSRSAFVSVLGVLFIYNFDVVQRNRRARSLILLSFFIALFTAFTFGNKDSAKGRLLIWICSIEMIKDKPLVGHGPDGFQRSYMRYQADFFDKNPESSYAYLADNVSKPFNEYISAVVSFGIIGLFVVLGLHILFIRTYAASAAKNRTLLLCMVAVAIFSLFSYPLSYPFSWLVIIVALLENIPKNGSKIRFPLVSLVKIAICAFCFYIAYTMSSNMYYDRKWFVLSKLAESNRDPTIAESYQDLFQHKKTDRYFLYNYASVLNRSRAYEKSKAITSKLKAYWHNYDLEILAAHNSLMLKQLEDAEESYLMAHHMCPSRFVPLYGVFEVCLKANRQEDAKSIAEKISLKAVKVESFVTKEIKKKAQEYLERSTPSTLGF